MSKATLKKTLTKKQKAKQKAKPKTKKAKPKVIVYSTPTCPYCYATKDFLKEHKIPFIEIDVSKDIKAAQEMIRKSGQMGVPVIEVNGEIIVGYDREAIKKALKIK